MKKGFNIEDVHGLEVLDSRDVYKRQASQNMMRQSLGKSSHSTKKKSQTHLENFLQQTA